MRRTFLPLLVIATALLGLEGCIPVLDSLTGLSKSSDAVQATYSTATVNDVEKYRATVYALERKNCISCHATIQVPFIASGEISTAYEASRSRVVFSAPATSLLVLKSRDGHCGTNCSTNGAEMTAAILAWATAAAADGTAQNISISDKSEIEMKVERLMPNATISYSGGNYDAFSYQVDSYGPLFGYLNGLTKATGQPNGPNVSIPSTTRTNLAGGHDTWFNGPYDPNQLPGFWIPKAFLPNRHFSTAFTSKYGSILASLTGNPTSISNIGFRSMTAELCSAQNLKTSPLFTGHGWLDGAAGSDTERVHIHAMATQAWMVPMKATSAEINILRTAYDSLKAAATAQGLSGSDAEDQAYKGVCQSILLSPQFWIGAPGKSSALIRATIRLASRLPTEAEVRAYVVGNTPMKTIVTALMQEDGFKASVGRWHIDQLGIQMAINGGFGGQAFNTENWYRTDIGPNIIHRMLYRSAYNSPDGASHTDWIGQENSNTDRSTETPGNFVVYARRLSNGNAFDQNSAAINAAKTFANNNMPASGGRPTIVGQAFDNRTVGLWLKQFNSRSNTLEILGGFLVDRGDASTNAAQFMVQTGMQMSEFSTRCSRWSAHPNRWYICNGSVTAPDGSNRTSDLRKLAVSITGNNISGDNSDVPLVGPRFAERWSPSGKQDGWSKVTLPRSKDFAWVSNTFDRFDVSCTKANTPNVNPAPNPLASVNFPIRGTPGCGAMALNESSSLAEHYEDFRFTDCGYQETVEALHMDPLTLDSFRCGKVDQASVARASAANPSGTWSDDLLDSTVSYGPKGFTDYTTGAPNAAGLNEIAWNLGYKSEHSVDFTDETNGGSKTVSLESTMNATPFLQYDHAQMKLLEGEMALEPIRLLEAILDNRDGLGDYRNLVTSPITYGSNFYAYYLATGGTIPNYLPAGYTPKYGLDRYDVTAIDRRTFRSIDMQSTLPRARTYWGYGVSPTPLEGNRSIVNPLPPNTGVMTMYSFTRPVYNNGGKMRTMAARLLTRLLPAVDAYSPVNQTLHKQYFLSNVADDPHLKPACIGCHINLDPLVRALYAGWECGMGTNCKGEVLGGFATMNSGDKGTGALFDQQVNGWEDVGRVISKNRLFAQNAVQNAYNRLYKPNGLVPPEHVTMIVGVTDRFMSGGYNYRSMILDLMTTGGYFEVAP